MTLLQALDLADIYDIRTDFCCSTISYKEKSWKFNNNDKEDYIAKIEMVVEFCKEGEV